MRAILWMAYLWPGVPQLSRSGNWSALAVALALGATLNLALIATFGWTELLPPNLRTAIWLAVGAVWLAAAVFTPTLRSGVTNPTVGDNMAEALSYYLKGNWFEAERALNARLNQQPGDLEARLMLATLLRHTQRIEEAAAQLARLRHSEGWEKWQLEIAREQQLLSLGSKPDEAAKSCEAEAVDKPLPIAA